MITAARRGTLAGTDFLGRDVYTRLLLAGRISLIIGLLTMLLSVALGYLLGAARAMPAA
jgi:peptide/nickel transport system permease protein